MNTQTKRVLIVEDYIYTSEIYEEILKEAGFAVVCVSDGEEALYEVKKESFDLILLDLMMPIVNGIGFLKNLKAVQLAKNPKIVLLTNLSQNTVIDEALHLGACSYLVKSDLTPQDLVVHVRRLLES